jgi:diguanylate cyclase (GGDEF)-like protein/PAS domain S-box-containing protein
MAESHLDNPDPASLLIVEDESVVAMDLAEQLREMGYKVCGTADNGNDAIALARKHRPRLVLMDIVLKGAGDGIEAAKYIGRGLGIPIIFLTAYSDARTVERAVKTSPYGYLTKPFQPRELRAAIEVALYKAEMERNLRESEKWFASTLRCVADGVIATDAKGHVRFMNPTAESATGWTLEEAAGRNVDEVMRLEAPGTGLPLETPVLRALREDAAAGIDFGTRLVARDGRRVPIDDSAAPIRGDDDRVIGAVIAFRDVSERLQKEESLRQSEMKFRNAFDFAPVGMALVGLDGRFLQVNAAIARLLGYDEDELIQLNQSQLTSSGDAAQERASLYRLLQGESASVQFQKRYLPKGAAEPVWTLVSVSLLQQKDEPFCYLYQIHDLTDQKAAEQQLTQLAHFDPLTGLANRTLLAEEIDRMTRAARRHRKHVGVAFLDLDHFKQVNDTLGHEAGDQLLQAVAERLKAGMRESDWIARLGGDEFVLLLNDVSDTAAITTVTNKIRERMLEPVKLSNVEVRVTASLGVALFPDDGDDATTLLRCADSALYHAKAEGRNNVQFYRPEFTEKAQQRLEIERSLHQALERLEFELHYQPIVSVAGGRPEGAEALIRWRQSELGSMAPDAFIPIAEEIGLIDPIGEWVLREACREAAAWPRLGLPPLSISVNLSVRQFKSGRLVQTVRKVLEETGLEAGRLCLEITEQLLFNDTEENLAQLAALKSLGVQLAIDDFGTGYSSLGSLKRVAPGSLKIDRTFVSDMTAGSDDAAIVKAVIAMAHSLKLKVVAEGIETEGQRLFLDDEGCDRAQGYYYARPAPAEEFRVWLRRAMSPPVPVT